MKMGMFGLALFFSASLASAADALTKMVITTPVVGAVYHAASKEITTTQTQWMTFQFNTGTLFRNNPRAHLWVAMDGDFGSIVPHPMRGRGIAFGDTYVASGCRQLSFEDWGGDTFPPDAFPGGCGNVPIYDNTWYKIRLHANTNYVAYWVYRKVNGAWVLQDNDAVYMPSRVSGKSDIVIGVADDFNLSTYTIQALRWGKF